MITNKGIELMSKYMVGQVPAFVSHIGIGCGAVPLIPSATHGDYSAKTSLSFEMTRLPVTSRSVINVDGVNQMVFSAEIPQTSRYGITEIGIYPAEKSNASGSVDSRILYSFTPTEEWLHSVSGTRSEIDYVVDRLDTNILTGAISDSIDTTNLNKTFFIDSENAVFSIDARVDRHEQPRYLENALLVRGDLSELHPSTSAIITNNYIQISDVNLATLDQASQALDEIRLAFTIMNVQDSESAPNPGRVQITLEFTDSDSETPTNYAKLVFNETTGLSERYRIASSSLKDLTTSGAFTWSTVNRIRIYATVRSDAGTNPATSTPSSNFFLALDALKFENTSGTDARYGLAGYTVAKNASSNDPSKAIPIIKHDNTASYIEFRFSMDRVVV